MKRSEIEREIYGRLRAAVGDKVKAIYHGIAPAGAYDRCPFVVYSLISDDRLLSTDNTELLSRLTMRIHVVFEADEENLIVEEIDAQMGACGFTRQNTREYTEADRRMMITDYRRVIRR